MKPLVVTNDKGEFDKARIHVLRSSLSWQGRRKRGASCVEGGKNDPTTRTTPPDENDALGGGFRSDAESWPRSASLLGLHNQPNPLDGAGKSGILVNVCKSKSQIK